jgi:hypothetical protein
VTRDDDTILFDLNCHSRGLHVTVVPVQNAKTITVT